MLKERSQSGIKTQQAQSKVWPKSVCTMQAFAHTHERSSVICFYSRQNSWTMYYKCMMTHPTPPSLHKSTGAETSLTIRISQHKKKKMIRKPFLYISQNLSKRKNVASENPVSLMELILSLIYYVYNFQAPINLQSPFNGSLILFSVVVGTLMACKLIFFTCKHPSTVKPH